MSNSKKLKVLFVSAEVSPFAKTGGLADVAGSLPQALVRLGHDVRIVMPRYRSINCLMSTRLDFPVRIGVRRETAIIREYTGNVPDHNLVPVYFIDNYHYFDRENLYCYDDEAERFAFFSRTLLEMLPRLDFRPDVIHCNDWQSGPAAAILKEELHRDPFFREIATLFTVHNLHYQGNYHRSSLAFLGLGDEVYHPQKLEFYGQVSYMKAGLVYADIINTVSRAYAREIQTAEYGECMEGLLRERSGDLYGIVNGIDYIQFDPETDPSIARNYGPDSFQNKNENKHALQERMKLPVRDVPVIGLISRLVDQKGLDLIQEIFSEFLREDLQFVLLGTGDKRYESYFGTMALEWPDKVGAHIGFDAALAQQIYAGSDIFLMPSRFEPCGLGQLISLRYGTIPVVRATGGLADTVSDYNGTTGTGNGFVFREYQPDKLLQAVMRAVSLWRSDKDAWARLVKGALELDHSWASSAREYVELYHKAVTKKKLQVQQENGGL